MSDQSIHFSTGTDSWETPPEVFCPLDKEFDFQLDPCCSVENHKCPVYITTDGLAEPWMGLRAFVNPPYSDLGSWIAKCAHEAFTADVRGLSAMLIPSRTDTKAFHRYIWDKTTHRPRTGVELRLLPGRVNFLFRVTVEQRAIVKAATGTEKEIAKRFNLPLTVARGILADDDSLVAGAPFPSCVVIFRPQV